MVLFPPEPSTFLDSPSTSNPFDNPGHLFTLYRDTMYQNHNKPTGRKDTLRLILWSHFKVWYKKRRTQKNSNTNL